jgi:hypothetical protein
MSEQLLVVLRDKTKDPDDLKLIQVAIAKQDIGDCITIIAAVGYEGGGCYSNFCGVYRMDEFNESVLETIEELDYADDSELYSKQLEELDAWLYTNIFYDEDIDAPRLNEVNYDLIEDGHLEMDFDWDNESHVEASQNWGISYRW